MDILWGHNITWTDTKESIGLDKWQRTIWR